MSFKAYLISQHDGKVSSRFVDFTDADLDPGEVVIDVAWSSVNYKDALAATGAGKIVRRFPCIGGIDLAGRVASSSDARYQPGDRVICTGYGLGVTHHGGYAQRARVPADWLVPLPEGMSLHDAMGYGTAGFTAGMAVAAMELNGLQPTNGPVIVSGATGGVGSIAIAILARLGYHVVALTGKAHETDYLKSLGAAEVMLRSGMDFERVKPLEKATWAGAVDNLGGSVLAWMAASMQEHGTLASIGLAASHELHTTVMPFILRGACLLGINSSSCPTALRREVWRRLAGDMRSDAMTAMTREIEFNQLPVIFDDFLQSRIKGRVVVRVGGETA